MVYHGGGPKTLWKNRKHVQVFHVACVNSRLQAYSSYHTSRTYTSELRMEMCKFGEEIWSINQSISSNETLDIV